MTSESSCLTLPGSQTTSTASFRYQGQSGEERYNINAVIFMHSRYCIFGARTPSHETVRGKRKSTRVLTHTTHSRLLPLPRKDTSSPYPAVTGARRPSGSERCPSCCTKSSRAARRHRHLGWSHRAIQKGVNCVRSQPKVI